MLALKRRQREAGQVMPLAAVGIFCMVLGVLATLNLGQAVHQKIKLQNTADAAAYTLAAMEARTFNYIAFLNRAQIAHYNTAMVIQSYITWVGYHVTGFSTAADMVTALEGAIQTGCGFPYPANLPYCAMHAFITAIASFVRAFRDIAVNLYKQGHDIGHKIVEAMSIFNKAAVWQTQFARAALLNAHILTGMQNYIEKNDKDISFKNGKSVVLNLLVNMALNSIEYYMAFDNASGLNPYVFAIPFDLSRISPSGKFTKHKDEGGKDAYRLMAELCHATRSPGFVSRRTDNLPHTAMIANIYSLNKKGQTKFVKDGKISSNAEIKEIASTGNYPVADQLASDDFDSSGFGIATMGLANVIYTVSNRLGDAVLAYEDKGKHYKYKKGGSSGINSPGRTGMIAIPPPKGSTTDTMEEKSNKAPWPGFAPYFKFKPNKERTSDFGQPSTWIFLNKSHKDFQSNQKSHGDGRAPWYANWTFRHGDKTLKLDTTIGGKRNSYLFEGLNVVSRGMAYYHRPGKGGDQDWFEHPNFFNPFWRARLAPVGQKLQNFWDKFVTKKITTKSDNKVVSAMVNLLRNSQMDMFTAVITSVITH